MVRFYEDAVLIAALKRELREEQEQAQINEAQRIQKIMNGTTFELCLLFKEKTFEGKLADFIELEGYSNAQMIFDSYKSIGFILKLKALTLTLDGKKVRKCNFNYK